MANCEATHTRLLVPVELQSLGQFFQFVPWKVNTEEFEEN